MFTDEEKRHEFSLYGDVVDVILQNWKNIIDMVKRRQHEKNILVMQSVVYFIY